MPIILTETARLLSQQTNIETNIILEIDGFPYKFGVIDIEKDLSFDSDGVNFDSTHLFDTNMVDEQSRSYISLDGTSKNITSQLNIDKGIEAVRSFNIELLDKDDLLSEIFTPGHTVTDLLGQKAKVYLNFKGSDHPRDSLLIIEGIVGQYSFTNKGTCKLSVDHAAQLKRQELFVPAATELAAEITTTGLGSIEVTDFDDFIQTNGGGFTRYLRINDEIMKVLDMTTTGDGKKLISVDERGSFNTTAVTHSNDSEVTSFYRLQGNAIELALKILLSGGGYALQKTSTAFNQLTDSLFVQDSILIDSEDIETEYGLVIGDLIQISASDNNNIATTIKGFGKIDETRSYITVNNTLTTDIDQTATVKFKSQYDLLPEGAGLLPTQLDVSGHLDLLNTFAGNFADMDFYLDEEIKVDEFINEQLYRPTNCYSVPGNRPSVKMTIPPLTDINTKTLDANNVVNPNAIKVNRSINRYHYNTIVYKYDSSPLDLDKYLTGKIFLNQESLDRIRAGKKVFKIESDGFRRNTLTSQILSINAKRFLDRYKFASEFLSIECFFSDITIECGDTVILQGNNIYDSEKGTRDFGPKVFEVINKTVSIGQAKIKLDLLGTSFGLDGRFGVVSPASKVASGATKTKIPLKQSFGFNDQENKKWQDHIGATIRVHSNDWSYDETTVIRGFEAGEENTMLVDALSVAPSEDDICDTTSYPTVDNDQHTLIKDMYVFVDPTVPIASVADAKTFTVVASDASKIFAGSFVEVVKSDYSATSEGKVASITSTGGSTEIVTLESDLSFTPASADRVQLIGFSDDNGKPYRIL